MTKNILIFPCGSEIGLELHRSLSHSTHFSLIGGSSVPDHGEYVYENVVKNIPFVDTPEFVKTINEIVEKHKIDLIIPAHDSVVLKLAHAQSQGKLSAPVVTSTYETCKIARSKALTYQHLTGIVPIPEVYPVGSTTPYPVFLKPDVGQGSKGTYKVNSDAEKDFYLSKDPTLMVLEYLPGKEYTIDCFTDRKGKLLFSRGRERSRISNGISVSSARVDDNRFEVLAQKINKALEFRGAWFFQVKEKAGELVLMEIAPRIAGTMGLERAQGVNLPLLSLFDAMDMDVDVFENSYTITIDRALVNRFKHNLEYKHVYLDFDDMVIFKEKVSPVVMAFVYQCINQGIQVHLLTKHAGDIHETLAKARLEGVFDTVTHIGKLDEKYKFIQHDDAIFVDDSFAERKQVHERKGIATFDYHMLEALLGNI